MEEPGSLIAALTNLEDPRFTGTLTVSVYTNTITSVDLGHMVQTLAIVRSEPDDDDLAALENIKASIRGGGESPWAQGYPQTGHGHKDWRIAVPSIDIEAFEADLKDGLADVGSVSVEKDGTVAIMSPAGNEDENPRLFTFADPLDQIRVRIIIDDAAWHSMWPGWTLEKASIAMFSTHVEEAMDDLGSVPRCVNDPGFGKGSVRKLCGAFDADLSPAFIGGDVGLVALGEEVFDDEDHSSRTSCPGCRRAGAVPSR